MILVEVCEAVVKQDRRIKVDGNAKLHGTDERFHRDTVICPVNKRTFPLILSWLWASGIGAFEGRRRILSRDRNVLAAVDTFLRAAIGVIDG